MNIQYRISQSSICPESIDTTSSKTSVYLRKNIVEKTETDETNDEKRTFYEYDEAKLTKAEYEEYLKELEVNETLQTVDDLKAENATLNEQVNMLTDCILEMSEMIYA